MKEQIKKMLFFLVFSSGNLLYAGEIDILLNKLVDKNILDGGEAQEIRIETQEEVKKEIANGLHPIFPLWLQNMSFAGDFRLRYQYNKNENLSYERNRLRYRLRFSVKSKINEKLFMAFGLASGENSDSRSTNQTLKDNFGKKNVYIDYAYGEFYSYNWLSFLFGKSKNPLWFSNDMLFDSDINPEGISSKIEIIPNSNMKNESILGVFILNENSSLKNDPHANFIQENIYIKNSENTLSFKTALTYYDFKYLKDKTVLPQRPPIADGYLNSNTLVSGKYKYNYKPFTLDIKTDFNINNPIKIIFNKNITNISFFGTYLKNSSISKNNEGWIMGLTFGQSKVKDVGDFNFSFSKRRLESDSWLDTYPDSDFFGGSTGVKGYEYALSLGLLENFSLTFNYYDSRPIDKSLKKEKLFQSDINLKF